MVAFLLVSLSSNIITTEDTLKRARTHTHTRLASVEPLNHQESFSHFLVQAGDVG